LCQDRKLCIVKTSFFLKKNSKILYTNKIIFFIKQTDTSNCDMTQKFSSVNLFFKLNLFPFSNAASKKRVLSYEKISRYSSNSVSKTQGTVHQSYDEHLHIHILVDFSIFYSLLDLCFGWSALRKFLYLNQIG